MTTRQTMDEVRLKKGLLTVFFFVLAILFPFLGLKFHQPLFYVLIFCLPVVGWFLSTPAVLIVSIFLVGYTHFTPPGFPGKLTGLNILQAVAVAWSIFTIPIIGRKRRKMDVASIFIILFLINMCMIIGVRGFGIASLGGTQFGGMHYFYLSIPIFFFLSASNFSLKQKHVSLIFWCAVIGPMVPFVLQHCMYAGWGIGYTLGKYFGLSVAMANDAMMASGNTEEVRWVHGANFSQALLMCALVFPAVWKRRVLWAVLMAISVSVVLVTGFRNALVTLGVIFLWWYIYRAKKRMMMFVVFLMAGVLGWVLALIIVPYLPWAAQRALSFLPLMEARVSFPDVISDARRSIDFRVEIWGYAWANISEYLLVGRGLMMDVTGWAWLQQSWYGRPEFFFAGHAYHSGPLSLLVDFGIPGTIAAVGFMCAVCVDAWRGVRSFCGEKNDFLSLFYVFLSIKITYLSIAFFLIYGDVRSSIPGIIMLAVLLKLLRKLLGQREDKGNDEASIRIS